MPHNVPVVVAVVVLAPLPETSAQELNAPFSCALRHWYFVMVESLGSSHCSVTTRRVAVSQPVRPVGAAGAVWATAGMAKAAANEASAKFRRRGKRRIMPRRLWCGSTDATATLPKGVVQRIRVRARNPSPTPSQALPPL